MAPDGGEQPVRARDTGQLALLVDSVVDYAIFLLEPDGRVATWNAGAERIKGYAPAEIIGEHFSRFYTESDKARDHPREVLEAALREGRYEEEGWRVRKDGTPFWADVVITALFEDGQHVGFGKVTRDLTERRAAEQALIRQTEELRAANADVDRFRRLVANVRDYAIFLLDADGRVASWNAGAERFKGYTEDEIVGEHFSRFYTDADRAREHPQEELRIAVREGRFEEEGWRVRKDGTQFWANVVITALRDDDGKLDGFAKVTRDLTERRAARQRLERAHHDLQRANEELRIFSSAAAHDLREPLRTLQGFSELLERRYAAELPPPARRLLDQMHSSVSRMQELIDALLAFTRSGARELELERVVLSGAARRAVAGLTTAMIERGAVVTPEIPDDATVRADRAMVEVVLQNLVENAMKFSREAPEVGVRAERRGPSWRVSVHDNGIGIAAGDLEIVFEPFRRLHGRGDYAGSGLGLATCRRAIERQGGTMGVESEEGAGSTFWFELPAADAPDAAA